MIIIIVIIIRSGSETYEGEFLDGLRHGKVIHRQAIFISPLLIGKHQKRCHVLIDGHRMQMHKCVTYVLSCLTLLLT